MNSNALFGATARQYPGCLSWMGGSASQHPPRMGPNGERALGSRNRGLIRRRITHSGQAGQRQVSPCVCAVIVEKSR